MKYDIKEQVNQLIGAATSSRMTDKQLEQYWSNASRMISFTYALYLAPRRRIWGMTMERHEVPCSKFVFIRPNLLSERIACRGALQIEAGHWAAVSNHISLWQKCTYALNITLRSSRHYYDHFLTMYNRLKLPFKWRSEMNDLNCKSDCIANVMTYGYCH